MPVMLERPELLDKSWFKVSSARVLLFKNDLELSFPYWLAGVGVDPADN